MITQSTSIVVDLSVQIVATVIGGIVLALIFFLVRDKIYRLPALSGLWTFWSTTETTSYKPYREMHLVFLVLLVQEGNRLTGTGEKIKEVTSSGIKEYVGKHRTHIQITGFIIQRFFSADECIIHIKEAGELRDSSTIHNLKVTNESSLHGTFVSTVANQTGRTCWTRGNSEYSFTQTL
jgi:hypothetical protein